MSTDRTDRLLRVDAPGDVPAVYRDTPLADLLAYHNFDAPFRTYERAELLVGKCMDHRERLRMPTNFAYVLRSGGANLRQSDFQVSFAIGVGGVRHIALIGHSDCAMVNVIARREAFIAGLVEGAGWDERRAEEHFHHLAPMFEIDDAVDFTVAEAERLRRRYPAVTVVPMHFRVEDSRLYLIGEGGS